MNTTFDSLTHKMQRAALGKTADIVLSHVNKDREKSMTQLVDVAKTFYGDSFSEETYNHARQTLSNPDSKWSKLINCMLDQLDPNVARTTALNLGYEAFFRGTKTIRENRVKYQCNIPWLILFDPTSACNMHCVGCWAGEYGNKNNLSFDDMDKIVSQGKELGVYLYMLTGGEPLVRKGVDHLVAQLKAIPGIRRVTMTTNGVLLAQQLPALLAAGLDSVNISLDTLSPEVFARITARDAFADVMAGIRAALESGLPVKLNCVPQVGVNEGELEALAALAETKPLQVRFIEMMPIGYGAAMPCISGPDLLARFRKRWPELAPLSRQETAGIGDGPAVYYTAPGWQGSVGFIAAVHGKFCASCNRVRLTSQGFLRPCLASEAGCDLKTLLRSGASDEALLSAIRTTIWEKPQEHHFELKQDVPATRGMYRIGG